MLQEYITAVSEGNITRIRSHIANVIKADPTFSTNQVNQYVEYALSRGITLFEPYAKTPCETPVPENEAQWDQRLFYDKVEDLRLNFAYNERIELIRKIGQKVYQEDSFIEAPEDHRSEEKNKVVPLAVGMVLFATLAIVLFLLIK